MDFGETIIQFTFQYETDVTLKCVVLCHEDDVDVFDTVKYFDTLIQREICFLL